MHRWRLLDDNLAGGSFPNDRGSFAGRVSTPPACQGNALSCASSHPCWWEEDTQRANFPRDVTSIRNAWNAGSRWRCCLKIQGLAAKTKNALPYSHSCFYSWSDFEANQVMPAVALADFIGATSRELSFRRGADLVLYRRLNDHWWEGQPINASSPTSDPRYLVPNLYVKVTAALPGCQTMETSSIINNNTAANSATTEETRAMVVGPADDNCGVDVSLKAGLKSSPHSSPERFQHTSPGKKMSESPAKEIEPKEVLLVGQCCILLMNDAVFF